MYTEDDWNECWATGHTPWRGEQADAALMRLYRANQSAILPTESHSPEAPPLRRALVPLCGDSPAVRFLYDAGFSVTGVEFVTEALHALILAQFRDLISDGGTAAFSLPFITDRLELLNRDIFSLPATPSFDLVYDRAALIALPREMRARYASLITDLIHPGGHLLLEATTMTGRGEKGPPFSVERDELDDLYRQFSLIIREETDPVAPPPNLAERGVSAVVHRRFLFRRSG